ncbi:MAG: hypothetical protein ACLGHE_06740 [Gammaproteobacteria bacterium]
MTALALLVGSGAEAAAERPQLKNFASYNDFMRAVVDYTRNNGVSATDRECRDDEVDAEGQPTDKENPCQPKLMRQDNIPLGGPGSSGADSGGGSGSSSSPAHAGQGSQPGGGDDMTDSAMMDEWGDTPIEGNTGSNDNAGNGSADSQQGPSNPLEEAIAQARDGLNPTYIDPNNTRTTFRSFPMQPIDSNDLANVSLIDALTGLLITTTDSRMRVNIDPSQLITPLASEDSRVVSDDISLDIAELQVQQLLFNNVLGFETQNIFWSTDGNYYSIVNANPSLIDNDGIRLAFSADARVRMGIVDSDGLASAGIPSAGAVVIDPLRVTTSTIVANLFAVDDGNGSTGILASIDVTDGILIDLSNTQIGVAGATRDGRGGWNIGNISNFLYFGDASQLSIAMDSPLEVMIKNPENMDTDPFITLNGSIDGLSMSDISLMDNNSGGGVHIGRVAISELALVNTSIYFNDATNSIRVDMGNSLNNLRMVLENIVIGGPLDRASRPAGIGDVEVRVTDASLEMTMQPH